MLFSVLTLVYLLASVSFIIGLKMLSHPETARRGNLVAAAGMGLAIFATIFLYKDEDGHNLGNYLWIFVGLLVGSIVGWVSAKKVKMTAMPEMVSLFNGMGGACALLISVSEFHHIVSASQSTELGLSPGSCRNGFNANYGCRVDHWWRFICRQHDRLGETKRSDKGH
jgi:NAD(P) transhydrogenase subunit beta